MTEVRDTGWSRKRGGNAGRGHLLPPPPSRLLADPELPPLFHFLNFGKRKQYLIHPHQRQQKQQIVFRFNIEVITLFSHPQTGYKLI